MQMYRPFLIIVIVLVAAVAGGAWLWRSSHNRETFPAVTANPTPVPSGVAPQLPADAVVTLEEFGDYQCPPCGALHPTLKNLKKEFGPNLNFIFRNLPLTTIHKNALRAAQAAEAARMQNRFWEMHDLLYESRDLWVEDINPKTIFLKFAGDLGLDTTRFGQDIDGQQVQMRIEADKDAAVRLGIAGTPTVLINGRQLRPEVTTPEGIRQGIEFMLTRKAAPSPQLAR